jgi:hypothetical protein
VDLENNDALSLLCCGKGYITPARSHGEGAAEGVATAVSGAGLAFPGEMLIIA